MLDGLRGYVQLASGLTEVTASKARDAAMALVNQGLQWTGKTPDVVGSVQDIADELLTTSKQNREMLVGMIRSEVDRAVGRMGFVREDELAALRARVERLEKAQSGHGESHHGESHRVETDRVETDRVETDRVETEHEGAVPRKVKKKVVPE